MGGRRELEIWIETRQCELRSDCELAQLHYHVSDQIFYDMEEVRAAYPEDLPIKGTGEDGVDAEIKWAQPLRPNTTTWFGTEGITWDGKAGSMVFQSDGKGGAVPIGIAVGSDPSNMSVNVATSGVFVAPRDSDPPEWRNVGVVAGPTNIQLNPIPEPDISEGDPITVRGPGNQNITINFASGGPISSGGVMGDEALFRLRHGWTESIAASFTIPPLNLGNIC